MKEKKLNATLFNYANTFVSHGSCINKKQLKYSVNHKQFIQSENVLAVKGTKK